MWSPRDTRKVRTTSCSCNIYNSFKILSKAFYLVFFVGGVGKLPNYTTVSRISWLKPHSVQLPVFYLWHFIDKTTTQQLSLTENNVSQLLACQIPYVSLRYTTVNVITLPSISNAVPNKKYSLHPCTLFPQKDMLLFTFFKIFRVFFTCQTKNKICPCF